MASTLRCCAFVVLFSLPLKPVAAEGSAGTESEYAGSSSARAKALVEAAVKAVGLSLRQALVEGGEGGVFSTKGSVRVRREGRSGKDE